MTEKVAGTQSVDDGEHPRPLRLRQSAFRAAAIATGLSLGLSFAVELALFGWILGLVFGLLLLLTVCGLGLFLVRRVPQNTVAWVLLISALTSVNNQTALSYFDAGLAYAPVAFVTHHALLGVSYVAGSMLVLTFPTGQPISPRWWWVVRIAATGMALATIRPVYAALVTPAAELIDAPTGIALIDAARTLGEGLFGIAMVLALLSFMIRFYRAEGVERLQLRYLIPPFVALIGFFVVEAARPGTAFAIALLAAGGVSLPVAIVLSILRYRLYEIDRIVSRTVTYAVVIGTLTLLVFGASAVVGTRFTNPTVVAAVTLAVAGLFNPFRGRVQRVVDRRFHRSFYDADNVVKEFVDSLRDVVDTESVASGWVDVVSRTMHPVSATAWIKSGRDA